MPDETADPFEEFKKQKEDQDASSDSDEEEEESSSDDSDETSEDDGELIDFLKDQTDDEGRPEGYWSHEFSSGDMQTEEMSDVSDELPGGFSSHRLSPEEQEKLNNEAREASDRPEGFESHRMDVEEGAEEEDDEHEEEDE